MSDAMRRPRIGRDVWHAARPLLAQWPMMRVARLLGVTRQAVAAHLARHPLGVDEQRALRAVPEVDAVEAVRAMMAGDIFDPSRVWTVEGRPLTGADLADAFAAVQAGGRDAFLAALGVASMSDRRADRAIGILRGAGLVRYSRQGRWWDVIRGG